MKSLIIAALGVIGLLSLSLAGPSSSQAQSKLPDAYAGAPKGGIAMVQDDNDVYIYDGSLRKVIVINKHSTGDKGLPVTKVIEIDKIRD